MNPLTLTDADGAGLEVKDDGSLNAPGVMLKARDDAELVPVSLSPADAKRLHSWLSDWLQRQRGIG